MKAYGRPCIAHVYIWDGRQHDGDGQWVSCIFSSIGQLTESWEEIQKHGVTQRKGNLSKETLGTHFVMYL